MENDSTIETNLSDTEKSRREFMKAAGKFAVYTPPALMLLMRPTPEAIAASSGRYQSTYNDYHGHDDDKSGNPVGVAPEKSHRHFWLWH
jgi:hypothetical protein